MAFLRFAFWCGCGLASAGLFLVCGVLLISFWGGLEISSLRKMVLSTLIVPGGMFLNNMGVEPKIGGKFTPQIIHLFIGFGTIIFTIHFGGFPPIFGNTHMVLIHLIVI